jgi:hypothetical protein
VTDWTSGIDISVYQGLLTQAQWSALATTERVAVVGSAHPKPNTYAEKNFERAEAAGMILATYIALYPGVSGKEAVQTGKRMCGRFWGQLAFVAIDCEVDGITEADIKDAIAEAESLGANVCIYTGGWWWNGHFGDPQDFKDYPLWAANYAVPSGGNVPLFGNWALDKLIGHQWAGDVQLNGVPLDRNTFRVDLLRIQQPGMEEDMAPVPWVDCENGNGRYRSYIIVGGRKVHVASKDQEDAFKKAGYIVEPRQHLSLAELRAIPSAPGTPEPDAP